MTRFFCLGQVIEAGGFFRQQGALESGVFIQLGHSSVPSRMGRCPLYQPICAKNIKSFLLQAQINIKLIAKVKVMQFYNLNPYRIVSQPC